MVTDYLTPDDVATQLQVSRQVVYNWINDGRLRAVKAGRTLRIPPFALEAFLQPVQAGDISAGGIESDRFISHERFVTEAQDAITAAGDEARARHHTQVDVEHLHLALVRQPDGIVSKIIQRLGIDPQQVIQQLDQVLMKLPSDPGIHYPPNMLSISARMPQIIQRAEALASQVPDLHIDALHIFQAIYEEADGVSAQTLRALGVTPERLQVALLNVRSAQLAEKRPSLPSPQQDANWAQRIEQQLARIENELGAIRSLLTRSDDDAKSTTG